MKNTTTSRNEKRPTKQRYSESSHSDYQDQGSRGGYGSSNDQFYSQSGFGREENEYAGGRRDSDERYEYGSRHGGDYFGSRHGGNQGGYGQGSESDFESSSRSSRGYGGYGSGGDSLGTQGHSRGGYFEGRDDDEGRYNQSQSQSQSYGQGQSGERGFSGSSERSGYGRDQQSSSSRQFDPDYHQWRNEQIKNLDSDYDDWRRERYQKFSTDFNDWRSKRPSRKEQGKTDEFSASSSGTQSGSSLESSSGSGNKTEHH